MYPPLHHQEKDIQRMIAVIRQYPLAMLVTALKAKPFVTHIPIIYNETTGRLVAHIDRFNPQVESLKDGAEVTIVFKGPDCYISPSIYTTSQLPTWNYIMVHIIGTVTVITDPKKAKQTMVEMTAFLERPDHAYILEKENPRMDAAVNYIQAFSIEITNWEGKFKLSQDKHPRDKEAAKQELIRKSRESESEFIEGLYK